MALIRIFLLFVISTLSEAAQYTDAICNDDIVGVFEDDSFRTYHASNSSILSDTTITVINGTFGSMLSSAVQPGTGTIYVLFTFDGVPNEQYLGIYDESTAQITSIGLTTGATAFEPGFTGMTFDCFGTLYVIDSNEFGNNEQGDIYTIDITNGNRQLLIESISDCNPVDFTGCYETIAFNWENRRIYRISSSDQSNTGDATIYVINGNVTENTFALSDGLCTGHSTDTITAFEYIGNDLFYVGCDDPGNQRFIRLLDLSNTSDIILSDVGGGSNGPIATSEIPVGILPYLADSVCVPDDCPITLDPTFYPTLNPTVNPTRNPSVNPTLNPSNNPTINPTVNPTSNPTVNPTVNPTSNPTVNPTLNTTVNPECIEPTVCDEGCDEFKVSAEVTTVSTDEICIEYTTQRLSSCGNKVKYIVLGCCDEDIERGICDNAYALNGLITSFDEISSSDSSERRRMRTLLSSSSSEDDYRNCMGVQRGIKIKFDDPVKNMAVFELCLENVFLDDITFSDNVVFKKGWNNIDICTECYLDGLPCINETKFNALNTRNSGFNRRFRTLNGGGKKKKKQQFTGHRAVVQGEAMSDNSWGVLSGLDANTRWSLVSIVIVFGLMIIGIAGYIFVHYKRKRNLKNIANRNSIDEVNVAHNIEEEENAKNQTIEMEINSPSKPQLTPDWKTNDVANGKNENEEIRMPPKPRLVPDWNTDKL